MIVHWKVSYWDVVIKRNLRSNITFLQEKKLNLVSRVLQKKIERAKVDEGCEL